MQRPEDWATLESLCMSETARAHRAIVLGKFGSLSGARFLDVGCGLGHLCEDAARVAGPNAAITGLDLSAQSIEWARKHRSPDCRFVAFDARNLPLGCGRFDAIACVQVAEYLADVAALLRALRAMLSAHGALVLVSTDWQTMVWPDIASSEHIRQAWMGHCPRPRLPVRLPEMLTGAEFGSIDETKLQIEDRDFRLPHFSFGLAQTIAAYIERRARTSALNARDWIDELTALDRQGRFRFSLERTIHVARP